MLAAQHDNNDDIYINEIMKFPQIQFYNALQR